jgi:glyoxylase-like metal-dependent hydrolase (beta-lactamase superfamily II)
LRIHHLNCGSHCPLGGRIFDGRSRGLFADLCTHCLLIETDAQGLVLVDSGYGLADIRANPRRLAITWPLILNPRLTEAVTAVRQVEALGFSARDVRHIVLTHLDFDHAGGIEDFPDARVHVMEAERDAAEHKRRTFVQKQRYRPLQFDDVRDWRTYRAGGETWFGFASVRNLDGLPPEILMIPLAGHTLGHAGVAIRTGGASAAGEWLLHAGDAYLHEDEMNLARPHIPFGLGIYERIMATDEDTATVNLERLRGLKRGHGNAVTIFCSHDAGEFERLRALEEAADRLGG